MKKLTIAMAVSLVLSPTLYAKSDIKLNEQQITDAAKQVYEFGFPMVMNLKTLSEYVLETDSSQYKAPFNETKCEARLYTPEDTTIVTPNSDTPYCMGWIDLTNGPVELSVPEMDKSRYYSFQFIDMYTHNFEYVGTRTNDNAAGKYLIVGPGWQGEVGNDITQVIQSETNQVFSIARTQVFDEADLAVVEEIQAEFKLSPVNDQKSNTDNFPLWVEGAENTVASFEYIDFALSIIPEHEQDKAVRELAKSLGLGVDKPFKTSDLSEAQYSAIAEGIIQAQLEIEKFVQTHGAHPLTSHRLFGTRDHLTKSALELGLDTPYLQRTVAAAKGIYGNSGEEALYPAYFFDDKGEALNAHQQNYQLRFEAGELPPVDAFWSLSIYDGVTQLFIDNALNRYLVNSENVDNFVTEEDGSIIIYIQQESPGKALEANWLPAPDGPFYLIKRLYLPKEEALQAEWTAPPAVKVI
jgi:hypothetical protein